MSGSRFSNYALNLSELKKVIEHQSQKLTIDAAFRPMEKYFGCGAIFFCEVR